MVKYTMRDQEKLGFAFIDPELGQTIAVKFQFKLVLIDHDDPCFAEKVKALYVENGWDTSLDRSTDNGGCLFRMDEREDIIWVRTFQGHIASAIFFHEIGHMLGFWLADRNEDAFCKRLTEISCQYPKCCFKDLMESYAWVLGTCMAAHIDSFSKDKPTEFTRDCVIAITLESGHEPKKRILFRHFAGYIQAVESKIRWHVTRKPLIDAVRGVEKLFVNDFVVAHRIKGDRQCSK